MRKMLIAATVAALALAAAPSGAEAGQTVEGSILAPTRFTDGASGWPGLGRRVHQVANPPGSGVDHRTENGIVAYVFDVDEDTWGLGFELGDVSDATGAADLDIFFYEDLGDDTYGERAPYTCDPPEAGVCQFQNIAAGGETGTVPFGATAAIVFTANGVNSTFTYTAG